MRVVSYLKRRMYMSKVTDRLKREDVPTEQTWDVTDLFANEEAWEKALGDLEGKVEEIVSFKNKLTSNAHTLLSALKTFEQFQENLIQVATYATLQISTDGTNNIHQSRMAKVYAEHAKLNAKIAFFESELLEIPANTLEQFYQDEPELKVYEKMLHDLLKKQQNMLEQNVEETLAAFGEQFDAPDIIFD